MPFGPSRAGFSAGPHDGLVEVPSGGAKPSDR